MGQAAGSRRGAKPTGSGRGRWKHSACQHQHLDLRQPTRGQTAKPRDNELAAGSIRCAPRQATGGPARRGATQTHSPSTLSPAAARSDCERYVRSACLGRSNRLARSRLGQTPRWHATRAIHVESSAHDRGAVGSPGLTYGCAAPGGGVRVGCRVASGSGIDPGPPRAVQPLPAARRPALPGDCIGKFALRQSPMREFPGGRATCR